MLTQRARPKTFVEIKGQPIPVEVMCRAVALPDRASRVFLFHGFYGTGKTTLARVFARALNCETPGVEPCGECKICTHSLDGSPYYQEYDCGSVGSVDDVRRIKETLRLDSSLARYRVVVFDEFHAASKQAQIALLKILEELSSNTFVIFCTTEYDKVLDTIQSRSIELFFRRLSKEEIIDLLDDIVRLERMDISAEDVQVIAQASRGHARDAVKTLALAESAGVDVAVAGYRQATGAVIDLLMALKEDDKAKYADAVQRATGALRARFMDALYDTVYEMLRPDNTDPDYVKLIDSWGSGTFTLFKFLMQPWAVQALQDDQTTASLLWVLWTTMFRSKRPTQKTGQPRSNRFDVKGK